jgi:hypothetical protein
MRVTLKWGLALASIACAVNPPPVPVTGAASEVSALAGEWLGEYQSVETGRSGSIWFKLEAGRDTAFGDVLMVPTGAAAMHHTPTGAEAATQMRHSQNLSIHFVRVSGERVMGTIDLYPSPDCECVLLTRFEGVLQGDRITGSFLTQHSGHEIAPQKGTWWVKRKAMP